MRKNPLAGAVFGALAIIFAVYSMVTETETPPAGYEFLNYGLIIIGAAGIVGSLFAYAKQKRLP